MSICQYLLAVSQNGIGLNPEGMVELNSSKWRRVRITGVESDKMVTQ
jgi:hypothetical protein